MPTPKSFCHRQQYSVLTDEKPGGYKWRCTSHNGSLFSINNVLASCHGIWTQLCHTKTRSLVEMYQWFRRNHLPSWKETARSWEMLITYLPTTKSRTLTAVTTSNVTRRDPALNLTRQFSKFYQQYSVTFWVRTHKIITSELYEATDWMIWETAGLYQDLAGETKKPAKEIWGFHLFISGLNFANKRQRLPLRNCWRFTGCIKCTQHGNVAQCWCARLKFLDQSHVPLLLSRTRINTVKCGGAHKSAVPIA